MKISLNNYFGKTLAVVAMVILIALIIIFSPWFVIWSINTLVPMAQIPFTFDTWCAIVLIYAFLRLTISVK
jgi:hypothetical protein